MADLQKGSKKLLNAWAFYDWANSVYTLTIASSIFPIFYSALFINQVEKVVPAFGFQFKSTALITVVTAFTFLVVSFTSPLLSGIADYVGNKKSFMKFFCYVGGLGCIGLYWFSLDHIYLSLLFYFMGLIGYWGSLVFYNSYLPDIAFEEQQDKISARGFSMGYIGSVILLLINLASDYGSIKIGRMTANAGSITIKANYAGITIGYDPSYSFRFDLDLEYASLRDSDGFEFTKKKIESTDKYYQGYYGSSSTPNLIKINSDYGSVTFKRN